MTLTLTLAVAGLTPSEKSALVAAIKAKAQTLTTAWTLLWELSEFPDEPDGLLYCPKREEGQRLAARYKKRPSCLLIAALPPLEATPSEVPLFVRMPFKPQDIVDTLNVAAKRILARMPEESASSPASSREEKVDIQITVRGASRVDPLTLMLYAVFHGADKTRFYKIRQVNAPPGETPVEIWCWPDLDLYWTPLADEHAITGADATFEVFNCPGKRESLSSKAHELRPSGALLWGAGTRAFKTAELLPWLHADVKMALVRWPDLPREARSIPLIRILSRLTRADATFSELLVELKTARKDLTMVVNGLIMSGDLTLAAESRPLVPEPARDHMDPEQSLFLRSLALRVNEALGTAIESSMLSARAS